MLPPLPPPVPLLPAGGDPAVLPPTAAPETPAEPPARAGAAPSPFEGEQAAKLATIAASSAAVGDDPNID